MDACLMSNLEVAYQARTHARYMVASEESEPNDGWPYDAVLKALVDNPDQPTSDLATHIVEAYLRSYLDRRYTGPVTQSAFNLSQIDPVAERLDALAGAIEAGLPDGAMELWNAQRAAARFWHNTLWDVSHFCEALGEGTASAAIRGATQEVRAVLQPGPENFVLAEAHNGAKVERCGGVTIYLIPPLMDISRYYSELDYAHDHSWLQMLKAYHAV
jgi:hypothetical protein